MKKIGKFEKWVESFGGQRKVAWYLGISENAVVHWMKGEGGPRLITLQHIVKLAQGALTYDDIINETLRNAKFTGAKDNLLKSRK